MFAKLEIFITFVNEKIRKQKTYIYDRYETIDQSRGREDDVRH